MKPGWSRLGGKREERRGKGPDGSGEGRKKREERREKREIKDWGNRAWSLEHGAEGEDQMEAGRWKMEEIEGNRMVEVSVRRGAERNKGRES